MARRMRNFRDPEKNLLAQNTLTDRHEFILGSPFSEESRCLLHFDAFIQNSCDLPRRHKLLNDKAHNYVSGQIFEQIIR